MQHTIEQLDILRHCEVTNDHLIINAKAGSGKTSTLIDSLARLRGTTTFQAFNKAIAQEITAKVAKQLSFERRLDISVSTVHSHGLAAFKKSGRKAEVLSGKVSFMTKDWMKDNLDEDDDLWRNSHLVKKLVGYAKNAGFGLVSEAEAFPSIEDDYAWESLIEHFNLENEFTGAVSIKSMIDVSKTILKRSNARLNAVDFDDMIYLPILLNLPIPQYNNVLLDEAQDINATRRELAFRSIAPGGRIIAVGDPNQAIYGFTGASVDSLHQIQQRSGALELPLSICWRCDQAIIDHAQHIVPNIYARPGAPEGQVLSVTWGGDGPDFLSMPQEGDAILCRLNKPNVAVCLGLLRRGVRARIEGRDIGKKLMDHIVRAAGDEVDTMSLYDIRSATEIYADVEAEKLFKKGREAAMDLLRDEVEAAQLLIDRVIDDLGSKGTITNVRQLVESLFGDDIPPAHVVTLSSVHKSKGREWPTVYILGRSDYMPFFRAEMDWEKEQEQNLIYVAITRAEKTLINVHGVKDAIDNGLYRNTPKQKEI